ncbi:MerR family transcriptional regulator [Sporolactobacillus sp. CQH2019]|uniref:MerR family transcriptional regulator n=1 Tax=Sporolactobacillus sp. CQH2019 TaxID=3023512 RepID=UPI0023674680|nr:MerR family transcriptional regulator [Sporolactobacillus sp. CQH2019]MDD9150594.1 MerR family transcriptional regulator [Sporolactobacillus sp. CQH2019]
MENEEERVFTVGELANLVGVTVRTLQYYDQTNLLRSAYNDSHKRVYNLDDLLKLQQILFLKSLGFSLEEIGGKILKQGSSVDLEKVMEGQREVLIGKVRNLNRIIETLDLVISETKSGKKISMDKLITILKLMNQGNPYSFVIHYFNDEQLKKINSRMLENTEKQGAANAVFSQLDILYRKGADPAGKEGQDLAKQWWNLVCDFASGDPDMFQTLFSAGQDLDNWPESTKGIQKPIEDFLVKAFNLYLQQNGIHPEDICRKKDRLSGSTRDQDPTRRRPHA